MTIIPIFRRELVVTMRRERIHSQRVSFAAFLVALLLGTFGTWYYRGGGWISHLQMTEIAQRSLILMVGFHFAYITGAIIRSATSIAGEKDRRTLEFLLATRLSSAEIILEKFGATVALLATTMAAGMPVMLLLHLLGGADLKVILLAYVGLATTAFFVLSLAISVSTSAPNGRSATNATALWMISWFIGPFLVSILLPRYGIHLPSWLATINAWLIASSPLALGFKLALGVGASSGLLDSIAWMGGLQMFGGVLLLIISIVRLRSAYRANVSGEIRTSKRARSSPVWRFWRRPEVGDDPILWREKYTSRDHGLLRFVGWAINLGVLAGIAYGTYYFAKPALIEVWNHGYGSGSTTQIRPEFNLFIRMFMVGGGINEPVNVARFEFNVFLRYVTTPIVFILGMIAAGTATEVIGRERAKETWTSLLATPLVARDILRGVLWSTAWRLREFISIVMVLWTIGLIAGAIHPLGYLASIMDLAASLWFFAVSGILCSVLQAKESPPPKGRGLGIAMTLLWMGVLPCVLPRGMNSMLLGAGSPPFVLWLTLASYRDVGAALHDSTYAPLQWMGIGIGEGRLQIIACCLIGIVVPTLIGLRHWRYALSHFDRFVGRPWRARSAVGDRTDSPADVLMESGRPSRNCATSLLEAASAGKSN